jgi:group I intron endonuclease
MKLIGIYQIQSKIYPERIYVGSTFIDMNHRWSCHLSDLRKNIHPNNKLQNHFNKYGESDLIFGVIESGVYLDKNHLLSREQGWYIPYSYQSTDLPYFNITPIAGSSLGVVYSEEVRKRVSDGHMGQKAWNKNIPHTEEHKQRLKDAWKKRGSVPKENYRKMLEAHSNAHHFLRGHIPWNSGKVGVYSLSANKKPIFQYDLNMNFIKEWDSATDVVKELSIMNKKNISACLKNKRPTAYGFIWRYKFEKEIAA